MAEDTTSITVAILDLDGIGITKDEATVLTNKLRTELVRTGKYTVLDRSEMGAILEEQGFQQTGCTSSSCAVEVGQMLGVTHMISGSIGKLDGMFYIEIKMIDVATSKIIKNVDKNVIGELKDVLISGIPLAANELAGVSKAVATQSSNNAVVTKKITTSQKPDVIIKTINENGELYINNKKISTGSFSGKLKDNSYEVEERVDGKKVGYIEIDVVTNEDNSFEMKPYSRTKFATAISLVSLIVRDTVTKELSSISAFGASIGKISTRGIYTGFSFQIHNRISQLYDSLVTDTYGSSGYYLMPINLNDTTNNADFGFFFNMYKDWTLFNVLKLGAGAKIGFRQSNYEFLDHKTYAGSTVWIKDLYYHWGGPLVRVGVGYKFIFAVFQTTFQMGMVEKGGAVIVGTTSTDLYTDKTSYEYDMSPEFRFMLQFQL